MYKQQRNLKRVCKERKIKLQTNLITSNRVFCKLSITHEGIAVRRIFPRANREIIFGIYLPSAEKATRLPIYF